MLLSGDGSTEHRGDSHPDHKKSRDRSRSKSRSRSPLAVLLPEVTEFILATGLVLMTGAKMETADQIVAHTTVMTMTDTAPVMTGVMMTDIL